MKTLKFIKATSEQKKQKYRAEITKLKQKIVKSLDKIHNYQKTHRSQAVYVYITFQSMNGKQKFMQELNRSECSKFLIRRVLCRGKQHEHKFLGGHWPNCKTAEDPTLIVWKNLGVSRFSIWVR